MSTRIRTATPSPTARRWALAGLTLGALALLGLLVAGIVTGSPTIAVCAAVGLTQMVGAHALMHHLRARSMTERATAATAA